MALSTATSTGLIGEGRRPARSLFRRAFDHMIAARQKQAMRHVNSYLLSLDDATLAHYGYDREELQRQGAASTLI